MTIVSEIIPQDLQPEVEAALEFFNRDQADPFEVTGILDPDASLESSGSRDLRLVLCSGNRCEQRSFRVTSVTGGYEVGFAAQVPDEDEVDRPAELDPPPGARRHWLDRTLEKHAFSVFLFYRALW